MTISICKWLQFLLCGYSIVIVGALIEKILTFEEGVVIDGNWRACMRDES